MYFEINVLQKENKAPPVIFSAPLKDYKAKNDSTNCQAKHDPKQKYFFIRTKHAVCNWVTTEVVKQLVNASC